MTAAVLQLLRATDKHQHQQVKARYNVLHSDIYVLGQLNLSEIQWCLNSWLKVVRIVTRQT